MILISLVVEPPRIAMRVESRFSCFSNSFFRLWRLRRSSAVATGSRTDFEPACCSVLISDDMANSVTGYPMLRVVVVRLGQSQQISDCGASDDLVGSDIHTTSEVGERNEID